ncbi:hypothetical protein [Bdellovibrio sp. HCB2-146]|uniref:hypothetical protein n=1 Tax=Bdellovibrio sp. HCB2-146 TaxID=3394362 RepID=UPI0039BC3340
MKSFVLVIALWSWEFAKAIPHSPFTLISKTQKEVCEPTEIANMPRVRSQDSLPICDSFSSATVLQYQICKINKIDNCAGVSRDLEISPLSTLAWTHTDKGAGVHETRNHQNLNFYANAGGATDALSNSSKSFTFISDACFPIDQLANSFGDNADDRIRNVVEKIEKEYMRAKTESGYCEDCLKGAALEMGITTSLEDLRSKVSASKEQDDTPAEFLYRLMLKGCTKGQISLRPSKTPKFNMFPPSKDSYTGLINKIKEVLSSKNPLTFDGVCLQYEGKKCVKGHSVVISGYRKVCKQNSDCKTECREVLKVQNSWGADWQKQNDDGWVDAKSLLSYVTDNPDLMQNSLAWYQ